MKRSTPLSSSHDNIRKRLSGAFRKSRDSFANSRRQGSASRNSSMYRRRTEQGPLKDPRNVSNRGMQRDMIDEILTFLQTNGFTHHITSKMLLAPASKDFVKIFQFLYGFIDKTEKIGSKIEEEFPRLMKQLRYPFPIAKSAMFTIGSLHTWPSLLAALHWLVKIIEMTNNLDGESLLLSQNDDDPSSGSDKLIHQFYEKTYKDFLNEIYDNEEDDMKLKDAIIAQSGASLDNHEALALEVENLQLKLNELEAEPNRLKELKQNMDFWASECVKLERNLEDMKERKQIRESRKKKLDEELKKYDYRRVHQIMSNGSIEHEKERLKNRLRAIEAESEDIQAKCWEKEIAFSRASSKLDKKLADYGDRVRSISYDPMAAEYLEGHNIEMKFDHQQTNFVNPSRFKSVIKDVLIKAENKALCDVRSLESDVVTEQAKFEALIDATKEAESKLENLKAKLEATAIEIEDVITKNEQELKDIDEELAVLKEEKKMLEIDSSVLLEKKKFELAQKKELLEKETKESEEKLVNVAEFLTKVVYQAREHKAKIKEGLFHIEELELKRKDDLAGFERLVT